MKKIIFLLSLVLCTSVVEASSVVPECMGLLRMASRAVHSTARAAPVLAKRYNSSSSEITKQLALRTAALRNDIDSAKRMVKSGADINAKDEFDLTALHYALRVRSWSVFDYLLRQDACVQTTQSSTGESILFFAMRLGYYRDQRLYIPAIIRLISTGAPVDGRNAIGGTPLHVAAEYSNLSAARLLVLNDADFRAEDDRGHTALDIARSNGIHSMPSDLKQQNGDLCAFLEEEMGKR